MKEMYSEVVHITPEKAAEFLSTSLGNPRYATKLYDPKRAMSYANDMKNGRWELSPQGIIFNEEGCLVDGHHRLSAIIRANVPVDMYVTYNSPSSNIVIDRGMSRTTAQVMTSKGFSKDIANVRMAGLIRYAFFVEEGLQKAKTATDMEIISYAEKWDDELKKVQALCNKGRCNKLMTASLCFAIFSALRCGVPYETLDRFTEIMSTGFSSGASESAAVLAKNYYDEQAGKRECRGSYQCAFYEECIADFFSKVPRTRKYRNPMLVYNENKIPVKEERHYHV